ncbi:MAG: N-acetylmuramoyl-L-alanine amidase [Minisyncoccia bacterium]
MTPTILLIHFTESFDNTHALKVLKDPRPDNPKASVSSHYLVHRDGRIRGLVPENRRAWHAGVSQWNRYGEPDPEDGLPRLNPRALGIEIENCGDRMVENALKPLSSLEVLTDITLEKSLALIRDICQRHSILTENVLGHDMVTLRKQDPGRGVAQLWEHLVEQGMALPRCPFFPYRVTPDEVKQKKLLGHWDWDTERLIESR